MKFSQFILLLFLLRNLFCEQAVNIGFILDEEDDKIDEIAVLSATNIINQVLQVGLVVNPVIYKIKKNDLVGAGLNVCRILEFGVEAICGPKHPEVNEIIQAVSLTYEMPQFQLFLNPTLDRFSTFAKSHDSAAPSSGRQRRVDSSINHHNQQQYSFNLYPTFSQALATLVRENDWRSLTILYENDDALVRLQDVLAMQPNNNNPDVRFKKLSIIGSNHRPMLKEMKASGAAQIILDCETDHIIDILLQAREFKLLEEYHSYILTSLDVHTLDFTQLEGIKSNITAFRILNPNSKHLIKAVKNWQIVDKNVNISASSIRIKTALLYDSINLFTTAFSHLKKNDPENLSEVKPLSCDEYSNVSMHGNRLAYYIEKNNFTTGLLLEPLTGPIMFNQYGQRTSFQLELIEFINKTFHKTGVWNSDNPYSIDSLITSQERLKAIVQQIKGKTYKVVSRIGSPYLMDKISEKGQKLTGNNRYEGYSMDLIDGICNILECNYSFEIVKGNKHGKYDIKTKKWDGLIGHLLDRKADLAVCDLTITYERRRFVDFTSPFMTLGISILFTRAVKEPPDLLAFTNPLSLDVWLYMATAYLVISMIIYLVARLNPNDWENPHPCNATPDELENIWNIKNCFWLTLGSIMAAGCDILPKGISTRLVTGMWWFFSLIMTAAYTANLAAFLTMERMGPTINSADDLAMQNHIKYGCMADGATASFFKDSNVTIYHRMWVDMESSEPSVFEKSNVDGVKRVISSKRKYAFLMESSSIEYEMQKRCDLIQVGEWLDTKGYGIATPPNAYYRTAFSEAILKMQERGELKRLKNKWWIEKNANKECTDEKVSSEIDASELGLSHVGGVFVVLAGGVGIALTIASIEFVWSVRKVAVTQHLISLWLSVSVTLPNADGSMESVIYSNTIQRFQPNEKMKEFDETRALKKVFLSNRSIVCNDGTQAGFYLRKSHKSKKWIIFLEGGWYCYDHHSCRNRWLKQRHYMSSSEWPETQDVGGILSNNIKENPYWWHANHVFIPYCTSDSWSGTAMKAKSNEMFSFMGADVVQQVIRDIVPLGLENSTDLMLTGSSAGGTGVMINLDRIQDLLHNTLGLKQIAVIGVTDSGWFLDRTPYSPVFKPAVEAVTKGMDLWQGQVPDRCRSAYASEPWRCYFGYRLYPTLQKLFVFQWLFDEAQIDADNVGDPVTKQQWDYIHKMGDALRQSFDNVSDVFAPSCISHSVLTKSNWLNVIIDDVSLVEALHCWEQKVWRRRQRGRRAKNHLRKQQLLLMAESSKLKLENNNNNNSLSTTTIINNKALNVTQNKRRRKRKHRKNRRGTKIKNRPPHQITNNSTRNNQTHESNYQKTYSASAINIRNKSMDDDHHHRLLQQRSILHAQTRIKRPPSSTHNGRHATTVCTHRRLEKCSWPQCNHSCPRLHNPVTGQEIDFIELLKSFGLDMESVAQALGVDMHTLNNMDHSELLNLLTQQAN